MQQVTINKSELLETLKANKLQHVKLYLETLDMFKQSLKDWHLECLEDLEDIDPFMELAFSDPIPQSYESEYSRAIRMLEMSVDDTVTLSVQEFQNYVMDEWHWKHDFLQTNTLYASKVGV